MTHQIKPGYYLAFQTHSESNGNGEWFINTTTSMPMYRVFNNNMLDELAYAKNSGWVLGRKKYIVSFGWRVKSVNKQSYENINI